MNESRLNIKGLYMKELVLLANRFEALFSDKVSQININYDRDENWIRSVDIFFEDGSTLYQPIPKEEVLE